MTPSDICRACSGCRSLDDCHERCGLLIPSDPAPRPSDTPPSLRSDIAGVALVMAAILLPTAWLF